MTPDASPPDVARGDRGAPRKRLGFDTRAAILRLHTAHPERSAAQIARDVGCSAMTVGRLISDRASDVKALTQALMQTAIPDRLDEWDTACSVAAVKGDHRPVRDYLIAAGAIEEQRAPSTAVAFNVIVAPSPGTPNYLAPAVNASAPDVVTRADAPTHAPLTHRPDSAPAHQLTALTAPAPDAPAPPAPMLSTPGALGKASEALIPTPDVQTYSAPAPAPAPRTPSAAPCPPAPRVRR